MVHNTNFWQQYPTSTTVVSGIAIGLLIPAMRHIPTICDWPLVQVVTVPRDIYATVAVMSGTMTGIVLTNLTILTSWWTNPKMRPITASSHHTSVIWSQLKTTIWLLFMNTVVCLAARQIDTVDQPIEWVNWVFWVVSVSALMTTALFIRTLIGIASIVRSQ